MAQGFTKGVPVDTDVTMAANSNLLVPSQYAVVQYVAGQIEQLQLQIQELQKMMQEKNKQIQEIYGKAE